MWQKEIQKYGAHKLDLLLDSLSEIVCLLCQGFMHSYKYLVENLVSSWGPMIIYDKGICFAGMA